MEDNSHRCGERIQQEIYKRRNAAKDRPVCYATDRLLSTDLVVTEGHELPTLYMDPSAWNAIEYENN